MNMAIEIHDTFVREFVIGKDGSGTMLLHAVVYRSEGEPGRDAGESGWQDVRLTFTRLRIKVDVSKPDCYAVEGWFEHNGIRNEWSLPFPFHDAGPVRFGLVLSDDFTGRVFSADTLTIEAVGDFVRYTVWNADGSRLQD